MATKKGSRGPKIRKYVLTVEAETGKVLHTEIEDPITQERKAVRDVSFAFGVAGGHSPGDRFLGGTLVTPGTRHNRPIFDSRIAPHILPAPATKKGK